MHYIFPGFLHFSFVQFLVQVVKSASKVRKVRKGAAATPLEEFRRLLGQLEQQMLDGTGTRNGARNGMGHRKILEMLVG